MGDHGRGREIELAELFAGIARNLAERHRDPEQTYARICELAVATLDACEHAGMSLVQRDVVHSIARTSAVPALVDRIQVEAGEGPCIDAIRTGDQFLTGQLSEEHRWPVFSRRAHDEAGIQSILAFRLFVEEDTMGALNLYSSRLDAFDHGDQAIGAVFAAHAAVAMSASRRERQLEEKAETRDVIGRAKGILMAREHITDERAFEILQRASQRLNLKLRDVADRLARGEDP
jgi:GAF domain-containing protein